MTHTRATREAARRPYLALVNTLTAMCQALPRSAEEANYSRATVFKTLPSVFQAWFQLILLPALQHTQRRGERNVHQRNEREARTLVEALDMLLKGEQAQTHEVTRTNATGILTNRDMRHAQRDLRDMQRLKAGGRGAPLAGRQADGS